MGSVRPIDDLKPFGSNWVLINSKDPAGFPTVAAAQVEWFIIKVRTFMQTHDKQTARVIEKECRDFLQLLVWLRSDEKALEKEDGQ